MLKRSLAPKCSISIKINYGERTPFTIIPPAESVVNASYNFPSTFSMRLNQGFNFQAPTTILPKKNLATFSQTFTTNDTIREMLRFLNYNACNKTIYRELTEMSQECIRFLTELWSGDENCIGVPTVGSTEACILAGYSLLFNWRLWRTNTSNAKTPNNKPNLVISAANQICWEKFKIFSEIELRVVPLTSDYRLDIKKAETYFDDNTIGIVGILGNTQAGKYDEIEKLNEVVNLHNNKWGRDIKIHIDGASGALFAPFVQQNVLFDFRLNNVVSISASGHKYGLAPCSIGWLLYRNANRVSRELQHHLDYLGGGVLNDFGMNFSTSSMFLAAQHHLFSKLGREGYTSKHAELLDITRYLIDELSKMSSFKLISDDIDLPVICYEKRNNTGWNLYDLEKALESVAGWHIATYKMPSMDSMVVHRIVIRSGFTIEQAKEFVADLKHCVNILNMISSSTNQRQPQTRTKDVLRTPIKNNIALISEFPFPTRVHRTAYYESENLTYKYPMYQQSNRYHRRISSFTVRKRPA